MKLRYHIFDLLINPSNKRIVALSILFLCFLTLSWSQDSINSSNSKISEINHIRWVSKFPDENKVEEKSLFYRLGEFFMGKNQPIILNKPISVYAENPHSCWVLDQGVGTMVKVQDQVGEIPHLFKEKYNSLVGICAGSGKEIFFTDSRANKVYKMSQDVDELVEFNNLVELNQPTGIAYSHLKDELWVVETAAHRISVFNQEGELIRQIGKRGEGPGEFNFPTFIWIDKLGLVYIVDSMNFRIQILNDKGEIINYFGQAGDATGYFSRPKGIATDSFGNIYIADALFHVVQIFDKNGKFLYHFGGQGSADGQFWMPSGIYIDEKDYIYVADSYNSRIQIFQLVNGEKNKSYED